MFWGDLLLGSSGDMERDICGAPPKHSAFYFVAVFFKSYLFIYLLIHFFLFVCSLFVYLCASVSVQATENTRLSEKNFQEPVVFFRLGLGELNSGRQGLQSRCFAGSAISPALLFFFFHMNLFREGGKCVLQRTCGGEKIESVFSFHRVGPPRDGGTEVT